MDDKLDLYWKKLPILDIKRWIDKKIEQGDNFVEIEIEWGYYDDLSEINLTSSK